MNSTFILLLMIFCHIIDDYCLQGWLASAKPWHILTQVPKVTLLSGTGFCITTILFGLLSEKSKQIAPTIEKFIVLSCKEI